MTLQVENLDVRYGGVHAVRSLSFTVSRPGRVPATSRPRPGYASFTSR